MRRGNGNGDVNEERLVTNRTSWAMILVATAVLGCAGLPRAGGRAFAFPVMSYNIQYGGGGQQLAAVADVIRHSGAHVVALQEVDVRWSARSGFADQAESLARATGMYVRFAPIYDIADSTRGARRFGVALLSRYPITAFTNHAITRLSTQDSARAPQPMPGLLDATIDVHGTPVRVLNTHLDYRADPSVRAAQVADMLRILGVGAGPLIVFGDLNAPPDAPELQPLFARLRDAAAGGAPRFTFPATAPARRIDYVLVSDDIHVAGARVLDATASDHRPIVVDVGIRARK